MKASLPWWSARWVWWTALVLTIVAGVFATLLALTSSVATSAYALSSGIWAPLGLLLWYRMPSHPIGPVIALVGLLSFSVIPGFLMGAFFEQFPAVIEQRPLVMVLALAMSGAYTFLFLIAILLFPDGRPSTPGQKWLAAFFLLAMVASTVAGLLAQPLDGLSNPFASGPIATAARGLYDTSLQVFGFGLLLVIGAKIVEFVRSESVRRFQLKWLMYVLAIYMLFTIIGFGIIGTDRFDITGLVIDAAFTSLIPAAMATAVLRHRLYEIDRLVSRTVSYVTVVAIFSVFFAVPVVYVASSIESGTDLLVATATLLAAAAFNPVRRRVQNRVDRRFNRSRFDAAQEVSAFASRMRSSTDADRIIQDAVDVIRRTMQPSTVGFWLVPARVSARGEDAQP